VGRELVNWIVARSLYPVLTNHAKLGSELSQQGSELFQRVSMKFSVGDRINMNSLIFLQDVPTKRERITFVCDLELKEFLEKLASSEKRSLSNFIEKILEDVAKQSGYSPPEANQDK
jgi:hypothetical protein